MSQRNQRVDRFAQMTKQEEIIAKKRQEILEKQRTAQLAKAVAAAQNFAAQLAATPPPSSTKAAAAEEDEEEDEQQVQETLALESTAEEGHSVETETTTGNGNSKDTLAPTTSKTLNSFTGKTGKITFGLKRQHLPQPNVEQPPSKVLNTFCNDGSFLENFKKILEKHEKPQPPIIVNPLPPTSTEETNSVDNHSLEPATSSNSPQQLDQLVSATACTSGLTVTSSAGPNPMAFSIPVQAPPPPPQFTFNPSLLPQGPPQLPLPAFFHGHHLPMQLHPVSAPPPPPPPPQLPMALANLAPLYMQLNAIPAPTDFDLNAIPKPQINLEAIPEPSLTLMPNPPPPPPPRQEPHDQEEKKQSTPPPQVFSETCIQLPTCIENLIALVAENGEDYEDQIRMHRSELHPALW